MCCGSSVFDRLVGEVGRLGIRDASETDRHQYDDDQSTVCIVAEALLVEAV